MIRGVQGAGRLQLRGRLRDIALDGAFYVAWGDNEESDQPLNSVGPGQLVAGVSWAPLESQWQARLRATVTRRWSRRDVSAGELFQPPGNATIDAFLTRRFGDRMTVRAAVLNLSDRTQWRWSEVRGLSSSDPVLPYLAEAGRSLSVSLNMRWQ